MLSKIEREILLELRHQNAFKGSAKPICKGQPNEWKSRKAAGMSLVNSGFARSVPNIEAPGNLHLDLTPSGVSLADRAIEEGKLLSKLASVQWVSWLALVVAIISAVISYLSLPN